MDVSSSVIKISALTPNHQEERGPFKFFLSNPCQFAEETSNCSCLIGLSNQNIQIFRNLEDFSSYSEKERGEIWVFLLSWASSEQMVYVGHSAALNEGNSSVHCRNGKVLRKRWVSSHTWSSLGQTNTLLGFKLQILQVNYCWFLLFSTHLLSCNNSLASLEKEKCLRVTISLLFLLCPPLHRSFILKNHLCGSLIS